MANIGEYAEFHEHNIDMEFVFEYVGFNYILKAYARYIYTNDEKWACDAQDYPDWPTLEKWLQDVYRSYHQLGSLK